MTEDTGIKHLRGPERTVSKLQRANVRQALHIAGLTDKNENLRYELSRLERALISVYLHPEHAKDIAARVIPSTLARHGHLRRGAVEEQETDSQATGQPAPAVAVVTGQNPLDVLREAIDALAGDEGYGLNGHRRHEAALSQMETLVVAARSAYAILGPRTEQPCSCEGCDCENGMAAAELAPALAPFVSGREGETA